MNKLHYMLLGAAGLLLASCSQEEKAPVEKTGNFIVNVTLPEELTTRANATEFGTGTQATMLNAAVYDVDNNNAFVEVGEGEFTNGLTTTMTFQLTENKSYLIVFFAQSKASESVYNFDAEAATVTANYPAMTSADNLADYYDCFYGSVLTGKLTPNTVYSASTTLSRPVAQINWGANDLNVDAANHEDAYGAQGQYITTTLNTKAYVAFDLLTGDVTGAMQDVTLGALASPYTVEYPYNPNADEEMDNANPYTYIAMQYILAPQYDKENMNLYNLNLSINNNGSVVVDGETVDGLGDLSLLVTVSNAPVCANYQTNIYGTLLTENVEIDVEKDPGFNDPAYDWEIGVGLVPNGNTQD